MRRRSGRTARASALVPVPALVIALVLVLLVPTLATAVPPSSGNVPSDRESIDGSGRVGGGTAMAASAAYPGLGQLLNRAEPKAAIVSAAEAVLIAALVVEDRRTRNALRHYEQTNDNDWYDEYSKHYDKRQTLIWWVAVAAIYGLADAYVDANLSGFDEATAPALESSFGGGEHGDEFRLGVAFRF